MLIDQLKLMLGLTESDRDPLLTLILDLTESRLLVLSGGRMDAVPPALAYVVLEVAVARFNRIGSEGLSGHTVEGESMTWPDDDFAPYLDDVQRYLDAQADSASHRGRLRFI